MSLPSLLSGTAPRGRRSLHDIAAVWVLLGVAACGTDAATEPVTSLTPADQLAVAGQVAVPAAVAVGLLAPDLSAASVHSPSVAAGLVSGFPPATGRSAASVAALVATFPVDRTVSCPAGGSARTTGTLTGSLAAGGSGSLNVFLFTSFAACGVPVDGRTLLLTADPGLEAKGLYAVDNRVPADPQTLSITGGVNVSVSGSRGIAIPCVVLLTVTTSASTHISNITGTVCGAAVSRQLTWSP
jgi:hypothetical protein